MQEPDSEEGHRPPPLGESSVVVTARYSNYVLGVLFVVYIFNFVDRQVLSILLPAIKAELGVSDTAMGFLTGFAFVIFYTLAGIPIARLADRSSRRTIIAAGLLVWSSMTAASGMVHSFWQLAAARVGVGVGEAAGTPPAHSLLSDYFPPERRATALSIYGMGVYFGIAAAYLGGSYIASQFGSRSVFLFLGAIGIPMAAVVRFTVRDLPRGHSDGGAVDTTQIPFVDVLRYLLGNRSFCFVVLATAVQSLSGYSIMGWGATFMMRVHEMSMVDVGFHLGIAMGLTGAIGIIWGGRMADRMGASDARWYMRLPAIQSALGVPFLVGFVLTPDPMMALVSFYPFYLLGAMYVGPMFSMTQGLVPPHMRATASAINLFVVNMVGLGAGPLIVGMLNDAMAPRFGDEAIRYSLLVVGVVGGFASIFFYLASRGLREDLAMARGDDARDAAS